MFVSKLKQKIRLKIPTNHVKIRLENIMGKGMRFCGEWGTFWGKIMG